MKVHKLKQNSIKFPSKLNVVEYTIKNDLNNKKNIPKHKNIQKKSNNKYIKSEFNIQKKPNEFHNFLTYMKSFPLHKEKQNKNMLIKKKNINISSPEIKLDKNDDTVSTVPFTKENIDNKRAYSCEKRNINKSIIFVKKKIHGNLRNSFVFNESKDKNPRNNSCICIRNQNNNKLLTSRYNTFNSDNNIILGRNNYYSNINNNNYTNNNLLNSFDNEYLHNSVFITNNNINLITNNNYITNNIYRNEILDNYSLNTDKINIRENNSVRLRRKKNLVNNYFSNNLNDNNSYASPFAINLKHNNGSQTIRYRNMVNYFDNFNFFNSEHGLNNNSKCDTRISKYDKNLNKSVKEINIKVRKKNIIIPNINNINNVKTEYNNTNIKNTNINQALLKNLNFEDLYLILKKFEIIKKNIQLLENINQLLNKQILENINMTRIFIYDLYKFYLNSSFEGSPQNLFKGKESESYLHFYSVILIISLGLLYIINHKIKLTKDYKSKILLLIITLQKGFLFFCDAIFENYIDKGVNNNIWINEIMKELNKEKIPYGMDHILFIKKMGIESYKIFNEIVKCLYDININVNKANEPELFLYRNFFNKSINYLSKKNSFNLEETFDKNIFKIINLRSNFANITSLKTSNNIKNKNAKINLQIIESKKKANITSLLFSNENINNTNKNVLTTKINQIKDIKNKIKTLKLPLNSIKNKNKDKKAKIDYKNLIDKIKVKEPYLDFPPPKKFTLTLDLDETLISFHLISPEKGIGEIHLRPGLEHFLDVIKNYYEIIVFTSGTRDYADKVLDIIELKTGKKIFDARLYREHTTCIGNKFIKDLSKIGRDLSKTLIVDNLPHSFKFQYENGILISSYYGEEEDKALIELHKILIKIYEDNNDVRNSIAKFKEEIIRKVSCLGLYNFNYNNNYKLSHYNSNNINENYYDNETHSGILY